MVIGALAALASAGRVPALPTWYTVLTPLPPLPLVTYRVLLKIVRPRKLVSLPALSAAYGWPVVGSVRDVIENVPTICGAVAGDWPGVAISTPVEFTRFAGGVPEPLLSLPTM